ncbi:hypothetical protein HRI_005239800 [Hibiscus trionum]|uniref:Endonuclease/exonuclease/phosphatase domain-containing protein n=1 Tax=Hibiscus trionum TaxID=183268 RepID=A0A9W7JJE4_HIBTR|nr:hypothetical protein HRI_005239800 [Hibiscus trionum]
MIICTWNVRGMNNPLKQDEIVRRMYSLKVDFVCLLETRVKKDSAQVILRRKFRGWNWLANYDSAYNGRIWLLWRDGIRFDLLSAMDQGMHGIVHCGDFSFFLSAIYGWNDSIQRRGLWSFLEGVKPSGGPWILSGDFNVLLHPNESSDFPEGYVNSSDIDDFKQCVASLGVLDYPCSGPMYTWSNHQEGRPLARKLDGVLTNLQWYDSFPHAQVEFAAPGGSDHSPSFIWTDRPIISPPKPFRFFNFWSSHPQFLGIVAASWGDAVDGNPMKRLFLKLKRLKSSLKQFNTEVFGEIAERVRRKRKELEDAQLTNLSVGVRGKLWHG